MRTIRLVSMITAGLAIMAISQQVYANGFYIPETSGSSTARACAVAADPQDASTIWYNPAGMTALPGVVSTNLGFTMVVPDTSFKGARTGISTSAELEYHFLPSLYVSGKVLDNLALGLSINAPFGLGATWPENWEGAEQIQEIFMFSMVINPNIAWEIIPGLSIAAGLDIVYGNVTIKRQLRFVDQNGYFKFGGTTWGFGGNAGILYTPIKQLSLAFAYRSRVKLSLDGAKAHFDNVPMAFRPSLPDGKVDTGLTLPDLLTFGVAYRPIDNLTIELDINYNLWSTYENLTFEFASGVPDKIVQPKDWSNALQVRFSVQYNILDDMLKFRIGYVYDQNPVPDETLDPMLPDNDRHDVSAGIGFEYMGFMADLGYMFVYMIERTVDEDVNELPGTYNAMFHLMSFSVGYHY